MEGDCHREKRVKNTKELSAVIPKDNGRRWRRVGLIYWNFPVKFRRKFLNQGKIKFIPYVQPVIQDVKLIIGKHSFPINFIEMITIRWKDEYGKHEAKYKIDSIYFRQFFNDTAIRELERFGM